MVQIYEEIVSKIENEIEKEHSVIKKMSNPANRDLVLFHTGKIIAYEYCIKNIRKLLKSEIKP